MQTTVRTLKVFLASPGDVKPERAAAEELVDGMNKQLRSVGWQIMLYRWEDAAPGFGRPQEIINENVDECAVFVGLLWERWGQQTGKYSSGFEEEFERALARRKATGEPEIWLVFKLVSPDKIKDPGPELSKVLKFRDRQISLGEVFYQEVPDLNDWKSKLTNWLWSHVFKQGIAATESLQPQQPASSPDIQSTEAGSSKPSDTEAAEIEVSQQLLATAQSLTKAIRHTELEAFRREKGALEEFDVARLYLLSASIMFRWYTGDTLQTHETNLIYRYRTRLELIPIEYLQLLRAVIFDTSDVVPGWFWFAGMTLEPLREQLLVLAEQDSSVDVRRRALRILREAEIPLPENMWALLPLWDREELVRAEAYGYLAKIAGGAVLPFLDEISASDEAPISSSAREAKFSVLMRLRPEEAFSQMVETGAYASESKLGQLKKRASAISEAELLKGAENEWGHVREFSAQELARRGLLSKRLAERLTEDPSVSIREIAFIELAKRGIHLDFEKVKKALVRDNPQANSFAALLGGQTEEKGDVDSVVLTFYRHQSAEFVAAKIEWYSLDGALAYKSLAADHFAAIKGDLRTDLENGFARVKERTIASVEKMMGVDYATKLVEQFAKHDDFLRSQFVEAALSGIAIHGEPSDVRYGRQYLASDWADTKHAAVQILCKFGTVEDVPALLNVAKDSWGKARDEAGVCALRLSPNPFEVARELIQNTSAELTQAGYAWLYDQRSQEVVDFFETLMDSPNDKERVRAIYYLSQTRTSAELENVLDANLQKEKYYYNVVTWLDRLLYSPEPLKNFVARELAEEATNGGT